GYAVFFNLGLHTIQAGKEAVVVALNPLLTILMETWFFVERLNPNIYASKHMTVLVSKSVLTQGQPLT
ncbi:DMT family transporter, partial [Neisseria sp. P0015.S002]